MGNKMYFICLSQCPCPWSRLSPLGGPCEDQININCEVLSRLSVVQIPDGNDNSRIDNYDDNKSNGVFLKMRLLCPELHCKSFHFQFGEA